MKLLKKAFFLLDEFLAILAIFLSVVLVFVIANWFPLTIIWLAIYVINRLFP